MKVTIQDCHSPNWNYRTIPSTGIRKPQVFTRYNHAKQKSPARDETNLHRKQFAGAQKEVSRNKSERVDAAKDNTDLSNEPETFSFRVLQSRSSTIQPVKDQTRYVAKGRKKREDTEKKIRRKERIRTVDESISSWISTLSRHSSPPSPSPPKPSNPLCIVHIRRQRQAIAGRRQKVHDAPQKDGRRWTGNKMKSATEFGAHAENYSRIRYGLNSNIFFALLVPSAFSPVATFSVFLRKKKREREIPHILHL